jgi:rhodanese-related sulfurtransferase
MDTLILQRSESTNFFQQKLAHEIGPRSLNRLLQAGDAVQVVDVRDPDDYGQGHVPEALNLPVERPQSANYMYHLNKMIQVVVYSYDEDCTLGLEAAYLWSRNGYSVKILLGGYEGWLRYNCGGANELAH